MKDKEIVLVILSIMAMIVSLVGCVENQASEEANITSNLKYIGDYGDIIVKTEQGETLRLNQLRCVEFWEAEDVSIAGAVYQVPLYQVDYFPLSTGSTEPMSSHGIVFEIPFDKINYIIMDNKTARARVELVDGAKFEGFVAAFEERSGYLRKAHDLIGRNNVAGIPSRFEIDIEDVAKMTFAHDLNLGPSAKITQMDGHDVENASQLRVQLGHGIYNSGNGDRDYLVLKIANSQLEIPVSDIKEIQTENHSSVVTLRRGDVLKGNISSEFTLVGRTVMSDIPVEVRKPFQEVDSIIFK